MKMYYLIRDGRKSLLRGEEEMEQFRLRIKRARLPEIKAWLIEELKEGDHYSCTACQDLVTYPHKCMAYVDYDWNEGLEPIEEQEMPTLEEVHAQWDAMAQCPENCGVCYLCTINIPEDERY